MAKAARLVICLDNSGYEVSLERRKIYVVVRDAKAEKHGQLRVVEDMFIDAKLPQPVRRAVLQGA